jgi:hypothetical protein
MNYFKRRQIGEHSNDKGILEKFGKGMIELNLMEIERGNDQRTT